jgi:hypothetical protein
MSLFNKLLQYNTNFVVFVLGIVCKNTIQLDTTSFHFWCFLLNNSSWRFQSTGSGLGFQAQGGSDHSPEHPGTKRTIWRKLEFLKLRNNYSANDELTILPKIA